jgi:hypothetical protein
VVDVAHEMAFGDLEDQLVQAQPGVARSLLGGAQADLRAVDGGRHEVDEQQVVTEPGAGLAQRRGPADPVEHVGPAGRLGGREQHVGEDGGAVRRGRAQQGLVGDHPAVGQVDDRLVHRGERRALVGEQRQQVGVVDPRTGRGQRRRRHGLQQQRGVGQRRLGDQAADLVGLDRRQLLPGSGEEGVGLLTRELEQSGREDVEPAVASQGKRAQRRGGVVDLGGEDQAAL